MDRLTPAGALALLPPTVQPRFARVFGHGSLEVEIYRPVKVDTQLPHRRDELYVVIAGGGEFVKGAERRAFEPGEVLFVPAGTEHRFENFSDDFATWVFFFGPDGGAAGGC